MRWKLEDLPADTRARIVGSMHQPISPNGPKAHKYGAREVWVDNIRFGSKLEAGHYEQLKLLKAAGEIRTFLRQVPFSLPGGTRHVVDWMIIRDGQPALFAESKGSDLPMGRLKRKQVKDIHGIDILLWKSKAVTL